MSDWSVRPMKTADIKRCADLEQELFAGDSPWSAAAFRAELASAAHYLTAVDADGAVLGYAGLAVMGRPGQWETELHTIAVDPRVQKGGIGTALLTALLARADDLQAPVFLEVRTDNEPAMRLYARYGFEQVGLRKRYYRPSGADAYTMRRPARATEKAVR